MAKVHLGDEAVFELLREGVDVSRVRRVTGAATGVALMVVDKPCSVTV
jgi:sugar/nucleoside kinase (ribokinase family)